MSDESTTPEAPAHAYDALGNRVAGILNAAEAAAREIRDEADRAANDARDVAAREADAYAADRRRAADGEADRLRAEAAADAAALRNAVYAAVRRIGDEGTRSLETLRLEARALESRFEKAVDDLQSLIEQLENVVLAVADGAAVTDDAETSAHPHPSESAPLSNVTDDTPQRRALDEDLHGEIVRDSSYS